MKHLLCYYENGTLIFRYRDEENGTFKHHRYIFYTFREALKLFREENGLKHKHIKIEKLF